MARIATLRDIEALERVPLDERLSERNTYEILARSAARHPDRIALTFLPEGSPDDPAHDLTYRELLSRVNRTARLFRELGGERPVVTLLLPIMLETHVTMWAAEAVGIANPINSLLEPAMIAGLVRAAGARILVAPGPSVDPLVWEKALEVARACPSITALVAVGDAGGATPDAGHAAIVPLARAEQHEGTALAAAELPGRDDIASYFHTGGTTALPKLARHNHRNKVYIAWASQEINDIGPADCTLMGMPLYHVVGAVLYGLAFLRAGARIVLTGPSGFRQKQTVQGIWRLVERFRVTQFGGVAAIHSALIQVPLDGADISSLRFATSGAGPVPAALIEGFHRVTGLKLLVGYGLTETTLGTTMVPLDGDLKPGSSGIRGPYQTVEVKRLSDDGEAIADCAVDETGVICVRGPNVFPGYLDPRHDATAWAGPGLLNTGDLGRLDQDGYLWVVGRAKDIIKRGGHQIDPSLIEEALCQHPEVSMAAAVGMPDAQVGELPVAYVQLRRGAAVTEDQLMEFARRHTPERAAVPKFVTVMPELPRTPVGKVSKLELRVDAASRAVDAMLADLPGRDRLTTALSPGPTGVVVRLAGDADVVGQARSALRLLPVVVSVADAQAGAGTVGAD